jgi:hypothetical protein
MPYTIEREVMGDFDWPEEPLNEVEPEIEVCFKLDARIASSWLRGHFYTRNEAIMFIEVLEPEAAVIR